MMKGKYIRSLLLLIVCLALLRGLIYAVLIPFDRAPDENFYFRLIKAKQLQIVGGSDEERQRAAAEFEVARYKLLYPESSKRYTVEDFAGIFLPSAPSSTQLYYVAGAWLLQILSLEDIRAEIFAIRGFSVCCGVVIVCLIFGTARELFPGNVFLQLGAPLFITFIPQFTSMNAVINNDKLAEVFAAALFWSLVKICKYGLRFKYTVLYLVLMILALLSKRTTVFSVPLFLLLLFVVFWKGKLGVRMHLWLGAIVGVLALSGNVAAGMLYDSESILREYVIWFPPHMARRMLSGEVVSPEALKYYVKFFVVLHWSFWGIFDYMLIHLHHFWYLGAAFLQCLSLGGLGKLLIQAKVKKKFLLERWQYKAIYLFGLSLVLVLLMILYRSIFSRLGGEPLLAQGRRFFTAVVPIGVLTVLGIQQAVPPKYLRAAGVAGFLGLLLLDTVCLSNYLLLNFHLRSLF